MCEVAEVYSMTIHVFTLQKTREPKGFLLRIVKISWGHPTVVVSGYIQPSKCTVRYLHILVTKYTQCTWRQMLCAAWRNDLSSFWNPQKLKTPLKLQLINSVVFAGWLVFYYYQSLTHILGCNVLKINTYSHSDITTATLLDHYYPNTIVYILLVLMADTLFLCLSPSRCCSTHTPYWGGGEWLTSQ